MSPEEILLGHMCCSELFQSYDEFGRVFFAFHPGGTCYNVRSHAGKHTPQKEPPCRGSGVSVGELVAIRKWRGSHD